MGTGERSAAASVLMDRSVNKKKAMQRLKEREETFLTHTLHTHTHTRDCRDDYPSFALCFARPVKTLGRSRYHRRPRFYFLLFGRRDV